MTPGATARLFVALDLPAPLPTELALWARSAAARARQSGGSLRLLAPESLHLTLCFLGAQPVGGIDAIAHTLTLASHLPVGELSLGAPLWLPPRRPRALAVEVHDDAQDSLHALHNELARTLASVCEPESPAAAPAGRHYRFRPHITLARLRPREAPLERALPATPSLSFLPPSISLLRSWLTPTEAHYERLADQPLSPPSIH
jgi:RNA 2',3'-cyclic 3'-phosphodiesterase